MQLHDGQRFFLHGPGGTGKTFVYKALCHHIRAQQSIVLCVASSGIAVLLLPGGHMAHSMFAIPTDNLTNDLLCNIEKNSKRVDLFCHVDLIIWDEAAIQNKFVTFPLLSCPSLTLIN